MGWKAVTESGRVYEQVGSGVRVVGEGYFPNADVKTVSRGDLPGLDPNDFWTHLHSLPQADIPEVGKSIYLSTFGDAGWRLSTSVVRIDVTEENDG